MHEDEGKLHFCDDTKADLHIPQYCPKCGSKFRYIGVGEYACEECGFKDYDDYGKVRNYIEQHPGSNIVEVEARTGVKKAAIRRLLDEERFSLVVEHPEDNKLF